MSVRIPSVSVASDSPNAFHESRFAGRNRRKPPPDSLIQAQPQEASSATNETTVSETPPAGDQLETLLGPVRQLGGQVHDRFHRHVRQHADRLDTLLDSALDNDAKIVAGYALKHVVPVSFTLAGMAGAPGLALSLLGLPLGWATARAGDFLLAKVKDDQKMAHTARAFHSLQTADMETLARDDERMDALIGQLRRCADDFRQIPWVGGWMRRQYRRLVTRERLKALLQRFAQTVAGTDFAKKQAEQIQLSQLVSEEKNPFKAAWKGLTGSLRIMLAYDLGPTFIELGHHVHIPGVKGALLGLGYALYGTRTVRQGQSVWQLVQNSLKLSTPESGNGKAVENPLAGVERQDVPASQSSA
jgi:hypothetical protein